MQDRGFSSRGQPVFQAKPRPLNLPPRWRLLPVDNSFGRVIEQVMHALDFLRAPMTMMQLQGVAQVVHGLMNFGRPILPA